MSTVLEGLPKPKVKLTGEDGNSFVILGLVSRALKKVGWTKEQRDLFFKEATSGDYDHLLQTCMKYADVH